jgi:hypothetical protein
VGDGRRGDHLRRLERDPGDAVQQPFAGAEDDRDEVQEQLVEQPRGEVLAHGGRAAGDLDVLFAGRRPSLLQG